MQSLYGTDITADELREEINVTDREALTEEFVEDALETYDEREQALGAELAREVERYVILQTVDQRWREHLEAMDYLREGVHLRAFAQKDPLVEYRGEGHVMFEELGQTIRQEVVFTLFHVAVDRRGARARADAGTRELTPLRARDLGGPDVIAAAGGASATALAAPPAQPRVRSQAPAVNEHKDIGRNDPCWCGSRQEVQALPRRLTRAVSVV